MHPVIQNNLDAIRALCVKHKVNRFYLVGSAVGDKFKPGLSDVDFVVEYRRLTPSEHRRNYFDLLYDLQELLASEVDLIELSAIRNSYFLQEINETKKEIYYAA
jgi:predicted nucleotidyltransferase